MSDTPEIPFTYTPSTEEVLALFAAGSREGYYADPTDEEKGEFDRWLEEHDRDLVVRVVSALNLHPVELDNLLVRLREGA